MKSSRDYSQMLRLLADWLDSKPEFPLPTGHRFMEFMDYRQQKESYLTAVRAMGSGRKEFTKDEIHFRPALPFNEQEVAFRLDAHRNTVCRKVQEEKWECDPLFLPDEEKAIGQTETEGGAA